ncbi:MAG TPA: hypothetical protein VFY84_14110 [Jiangellales bacterium]|nr:hypothetical protein [Jiangellales bacterium]
MSEILKVRQIVPDDFAATLRAMWADGDRRLNALLHSANRNGWTLTALGNALGMTREAVRKRILCAEPFASTDLPEFPLPPRKPTPAPRVRPALLVPPEIIAQLREMWEIARTVNGSAPSDDPRRRVSERFTAQLAALVDQGVTVYRLAKDLGITHGAIRFRLARHGYRTPVAAVEIRNGQYKGRPPQHWQTGPCTPERHLTGSNVGRRGNGGRYCKACARTRDRARRAARLASTEAA